MHFTHDTELALHGTAALINSASLEPDGLADLQALDDFTRDWQYSGSRTKDQAELDAVRRLRPRLRTIWTAEPDARVAEVNRLLRDASALPQLVRHDHWDWHLHAVGDSEPLAERIAVEAAMALVDVIRADETRRLRRCAAPDCQKVMFDQSRNRSKRYCDAACGNRIAAAAYRARRSDGE